MRAAYYIADKQSSWTLALALYKDFVVPEATKGKYLSSQMSVGVMMLPCVILFTFFQKELMEGITRLVLKAKNFYNMSVRSATKR